MPHSTTLIIPTKNEEGCIGKVLSEVSRYAIQQIIVVDGQSTDDTIREAKRFLKKGDIVFIQKKLGYGQAFIEGLKKAKGNIVIMMDGDGSHDPKNIPSLLQKMSSGRDYVMASRYAIGGKSLDDTPLRLFGNKLFTFLTNIIHQTHVSDSLYLFTAIHTKDIKSLHLSSPGFEFCTEIIVKARRAGLTFHEVPVTERPRLAGNSKVNSLWHGLKILGMILRRYN